jgi:hypothetical protein
VSPDQDRVQQISGLIRDERLPGSLTPLVAPAYMSDRMEPRCPISVPHLPPPTPTAEMKPIPMALDDLEAARAALPAARRSP